MRARARLGKPLRSQRLASRFCIEIDSEDRANRIEHANKGPPPSHPCVTENSLVNYRERMGGEEEGGGGYKSDFRDDAAALGVTRLPRREDLLGFSLVVEDEEENAPLFHPGAVNPSSLCLLPSPFSFAQRR